jgi:alanine-glyoxylate transaminase/serine-glyoxylate transaminase/serine-pyruvate transaminase
MAVRNGGDVRIMNFEPGKIITLSKTREFMQIHRPKVFFIAHGESSTGVLQPLEGFGELCREYNCYLVVDAVITLGAVPFYADKWKIDVVYSGTQKVLNAPPGISPISFNERAL